MAGLVKLHCGDGWVREWLLRAVRGLTLFAANANSSTVLIFVPTAYVPPNGRSGV
jgi:hypothetical protein